MNKFKWNALCQEFPGLNEINEEFQTLRWKNYVDLECKVKRCDSEWLRSVPRGDWASGSLVSIARDHTVFVALKDGIVVDLMVENSGRSIDHSAHSDDTYSEGESILEALDRWIDKGGDPSEISYFINCFRGTIVENSDSRGLLITIRKLERGATLSERIEEAKKEALAQVRAEANF